MEIKNEVRKYDANVLENIGKDGEMYSLNDLWVIAGSPENKDPRQWVRLPQVLEFMQSAERFLNVGKSHIIKSKRGKGGGTYGVKQVALEYAQYLDSDLAVIVNEVFFQRIEEERNPEIIGRRYIEAYKRRNKDDKWIVTRLQGIDTRRGFTNVLKSHEVTGKGYGRCTNAIYRSLYGCDANGIRVKKSLPAKGSIRDNMSRTELIAVQLAESLATDKIEEYNVLGNRRCEIVSENASKCVAGAVIKFRSM